MASRLDLIKQYQSLATQIRRDEAAKTRIVQLEAENSALREQLTMVRVQNRKLAHEILTMRHTVTFQVVRMRIRGSLGGVAAEEKKEDSLCGEAVEEKKED